MAGTTREVLHHEQETSRDKLDRPVLDEYRSVRDHLHIRLCREVQELESRIRVLQASESRHSAAIIQTYERMITQKRAFMVQWGMAKPGSRESSTV